MAFEIVRLTVPGGKKKGTRKEFANEVLEEINVSRARLPQSSRKMQTLTRQVSAAQTPLPGQKKPEAEDT